MATDWRQGWEDALFAEDTALQEFARASARGLGITALEEIDGQIQARIRIPQGGVSVQVALARHSLRNWTFCLAQVLRTAPEIGRSLLTDPDPTLPAFLSRLGWPLFPLGLHDVQLQAVPPSCQEPCPYCLGILVEVGWMIEADPWVLLSLRGLSRADARRLLQGMVGSGGQDAHSEGWIPPSESFWGNARALRGFHPHIFLGAASAPPKITLGTPPLADADERRSLEYRLACLYDPGAEETN